MLQLLAYVASVSVLGAYYLSGKFDNPVIFDVANVIGACILIPANLAAGAGFGAILTAGFGFIAGRALWRRYVKRDVEQGVDPAKSFDV